MASTFDIRFGQVASLLSAARPNALQTVARQGQLIVRRQSFQHPRLIRHGLRHLLRAVPDQRVPGDRPVAQELLHRRP
jgi:hypothetical protein